MQFFINILGNLDFTCLEPTLSSTYLYFYWSSQDFPEYVCASYPVSQLYITIEHI